MRELRALAAALTFLTRLPVARVIAHDLDDLSRAATYFPVVGAIVGGIGAVVAIAAARLWPPVVAVIVAVGVTVWITGAFHEDALADAFDGFGGGWDTPQILAIMKDSRVGSYALVGVFLVLAAKIGSLTAIAAAGAHSGDSAGGMLPLARALVVGHTLGRWSSVPLMWRLPYVRPVANGQRASAGSPFMSGTTGLQVIGSTALTLALVVPLLGLRAYIVLPAATLVVLAAGRYFSRRIGGITGDALGAANQFVELTVYMALAARIHA